MWDMRLPFCIGVRQRSGAGPPSADQASHESPPALLTMRGARRSHDTIARTADRHPRSRQWESEFARPMNEIPKLVFSKTLQRAEWPEARIARGELSE